MGFETNVFSIDKFSKRLRELRGEKTLQEVADGVGITRVAMGYYEKGERKPDSEILFKIAKYYNVSADYLLGLSDVKTPDTTIRDISEKTGLSETAICSLFREKSSEKIGKINSEHSIIYDNDEKPRVNLMNYFLSGDSDANKLIDYLYEYIFRSNFKYTISDDNSLHTYIKLTDCNEKTFSMYKVSMLHNAILLNINNCLSIIREKHIKNTK